MLIFIDDRSTDILEGQLREERYTELEVEEDIMLLDDRDKHWKDIVEEKDEDKGKVCALR